MIENLFNGLIESLFGADPSGSIQRMGGTTLLIVGLIGLVVLGIMSYVHFTKSKKFDGTFWLLAIGSVLGGVLAYGGWKFLTDIAQTVNNGL